MASPKNRLLMIDNSRAFARHATPLRLMNEMGGAIRALFWITDFDPDLERFPTTYSQQLVDQLRSLTEEGLKEALGRYVEKPERRRLLERRDSILTTIGKLNLDSGGLE